MRDNTILISGVVYRRSLHDSLGPFDESLPFYWDWDWYLRVARAGSFADSLQRPVVAIRVHARNMSGESLERQRRANLDRVFHKARTCHPSLSRTISIASPICRRTQIAAGCNAGATSDGRFHL